MREDFGYAVKSVSDHQHKELMPEEICDIFHTRYVNIKSPIELVDYHVEKQDGIEVALELIVNGEKCNIKGKGNGRFDAVGNAIKEHLGIRYGNLTYAEHAMEQGQQTSSAVAYVSLQATDGDIVWGAGIDTDITTASIHALISAVNRLATK